MKKSSSVGLLLTLAAGLAVFAASVATAEEFDCCDPTAKTACAVQCTTGETCLLRFHRTTKTTTGSCEKTRLLGSGNWTKAVAGDLFAECTSDKVCQDVVNEWKRKQEKPLHTCLEADLGHFICLPTNGLLTSWIRTALQWDNSVEGEGRMELVQLYPTHDADHTFRQLEAAELVHFLKNDDDSHYFFTDQQGFISETQDVFQETYQNTTQLKDPLRERYGDLQPCCRMKDGNVMECERSHKFSLCPAGTICAYDGSLTQNGTQFWMSINKVSCVNETKNFTKSDSLNSTSNNTLNNNTFNCLSNKMETTSTGANVLPWRCTCEDRNLTTCSIHRQALASMRKAMTELSITLCPHTMTRDTGVTAYFKEESNAFSCTDLQHCRYRYSEGQPFKRIAECHEGPIRTGPICRLDPNPDTTIQDEQLLCECRPRDCGNFDLMETARKKPDRGQPPGKTPGMTTTAIALLVAGGVLFVAIVAGVIVISRYLLRQKEADDAKSDELKKEAAKAFMPVD